VVRFKTKATAMAPATPATYKANSTRPCSSRPPQTRCGGIKAPMMSAYTGSRAEQVISGAIMMVVSRSRGF
jgi:hypothetical protein